MAKYDLGEPANDQLEDLCEAMDGATQRTVLRNAFVEYLDKMLKGNEVIRERYDQLQARRLQT